MARDPALKPYRIGVYCAYGLVCGLLFMQLLRSVVGDLYGREPVNAVTESPTACLEDVQRLWEQLSARAVQPAPGGIESNALSKEWDAWSRRWEDEVESVSVRCRLDSPSDAASRSLSDALDGIEDLRRRLSRSGEDAAEDARRVKDSLADARKHLGLK
ncbi:MAG: hypothetical protein ABR567_06245 [Myxococcales bacterium]|nr:hypothetical protein [Myxococcales bacterium]